MEQSSSQRVGAGRVLIKPISQVLVSVKGRADQDIFSDAAKSILQWIAPRSGRKLPEEAWQLKPFETVEIGTQRAAAASMPELKVWAARLDDADKAVPMRNWTTEVVVAGSDEDPALMMLGVRVICTMRGEILPVDRTVPGFVRAMASDFEIVLDGKTVAAEPISLETDNDLVDFVDFLESKSRTANVLVLGAAPLADADEACVCSPFDIAKAVMGGGFVYVLPSKLKREFFQIVGADLGVRSRDARLYRPNFARIGGDPRHHPYFPAHRLLAIEQEQAGQGARYLASRVLEDAVRGMAREERLPSFLTIRQQLSEAARKRAVATGKSDAELIALFEAENGQLQRALAEERESARGLLEESDRERDEILSDMQEARGETFALRERIRVLEEQLKECGVHRPASIPSSLDGFELWCQTNLAGHVSVHSRAVQRVKKAVFRDVPLMYESLLLLRDFYVPMKRSPGKERVDAFEGRCRELAIENSPVGEAVKRYKSDYAMQWGGRARTLDWHLKSGDARDRARCFRLYYFWDEESGMVIVGDMPEHLRSDLT